jgi:hypothetical protein
MFSNSIRNLYKSIGRDTPVDGESKLEHKGDKEAVRENEDNKKMIIGFNSFI